MKKNYLVYFLTIILFVIYSCSKDNEFVNKPTTNSIYGYWKQPTPNYILEFGKDSLLSVYKLSYNDTYYLYDKKSFLIFSETNIIINGKTMLYKFENGKLTIYDENQSSYYSYPLTNCNKPDINPIPNKYVRISISLGYGSADYDLNETYSCKTINKPRFPSEQIGFGSVLVVNASDFNSNIFTYKFYAYNAVCPIECDENIQIVPDNFNPPGKSIYAFTATCPKCGTVYNIYDGTGYPKNGGKYSLFQYKVTSQSNQSFLITNFLY